MFYMTIYVIIYSVIAQNENRKKDKKAHPQVSLRVYSENNAEPVFF